MKEDPSGPSQALTFFDVTSLVVGAVIGADIYVVASSGASLLGPAQLLAWAAAGAMAACIALAFAQCAAIIPKAGGPYAYVRQAFGHFPGFIVGWSLYLSEWINLAVFPIAFVRYLDFFFKMPWWEAVAVKAAFVGFLLATNYFGAKAASRTNDALTMAKLGPLVFFILAGLAFILLKPAESFGSLTPFAPLGWGGFGPTLILVFWAYAGFELAVIPAAEVVDSRKTLPRGLLFGMTLATIFYLLVNAVVVLVVPQVQLAATATPLADGLGRILATVDVPIILGGGVMAAGALLSISGADESATLGTSRLGYVLAADGYFPHFLARTHPRYGTPYIALIFQSITALAVALVGGFITLITLSVVFLAVAYLATGLASFRLLSEEKQSRLHVPGLRVFLIIGMLSSLYLLTQAGLMTLLIGTGLMALGIIIYWLLAPREEIEEVKREISSDEYRLLERLRFLEKPAAQVWRWLSRS